MIVIMSLVFWYLLDFVPHGFAAVAAAAFLAGAFGAKRSAAAQTPAVLATPDAPRRFPSSERPFQA